MDKPIVAIVALAFLEGMAMWTGNDGVMFATVTALIGGIAGYSFKKELETAAKKVREPIKKVVVPA